MDKKSLDYFYFHLRIYLFVFCCTLWHGAILAPQPEIRPWPSTGGARVLPTGLPRSP